LAHGVVSERGCSGAVFGGFESEHLGGITIHMKWINAIDFNDET
jgi:hypothetical protein